MSSGRFRFEEHIAFAPELAPSESSQLSTVLQRFNVKSPLTHMAFSMIVAYRPWLLPLHMTAEYKFQTVQGSDGKLHWFSVPLAAQIPMPDKVSETIVMRDD